MGVLCTPQHECFIDGKKRLMDSPIFTHSLCPIFYIIGKKIYFLIPLIPTEENIRLEFKKIILIGIQNIVSWLTSLFTFFSFQKNVQQILGKPIQETEEVVPENV